LDHVGQQAEESSPLDRLGKLALLLCRYRSDPARYDLAALRDVALEQAGIHVVDLRRVIAGERTGLAAPEERPAATLLSSGHHDFSSSLAAALGRSPRSPRSPRSSRSRRGGRRSPRSSRSRPP